jgi:hypothetical protein
MCLLQLMRLPLLIYGLSSAVCSNQDMSLPQAIDSMNDSCRSTVLFYRWLQQACAGKLSTGRPSDGIKVPAEIHWGFDIRNICGEPLTFASLDRLPETVRNAADIARRKYQQVQGTVLPFNYLTMRVFASGSELQTHDCVYGDTFHSVHTVWYTETDIIKFECVTASNSRVSTSSQESKSSKAFRTRARSFTKRTADLFRQFVEDLLTIGQFKHEFTITLAGCPLHCRPCLVRTRQYKKSSQYEPSKYFDHMLSISPHELGKGLTNQPVCIQLVFRLLEPRPPC